MTERRILMGVIGRPHGVRGHVHVASYTASPADLAAYGVLSSADGRRFTLRWTGDGVAELSEIVDGRAVRLADRGAAERLTNVQLFVDRDRLAPPDDDEFYLADVIGLLAIDAVGAALGTIAAVHDYGAGASLEVERAGGRPLLVPFTREAVPVIDLAAGRVTVAPPVEIEPPQQAAPRQATP